MSQSDNLRVCFYKAHPDGLHTADRALMHTPLPLSLTPVADPSAPRVTYGDYFQAIRTALLGKRDELTHICSRRLHEPDAAIGRIDIIAEKHGNDYHPARIRAYTDKGPSDFVMNVAVGMPNRCGPADEMRILRDLSTRFPRCFVPEVFLLYEAVEQTSFACHSSLSMFLGEWLTGYHELHLSEVGSASNQSVVLWDSDSGYRVLTPEEEIAFYRRAALILAYYYDIRTGSEIFPWHMAAGDFVATAERSKPDVRLITVRQYAPRAVFGGKCDAESRMLAWMAFLANLTIRMRLDRYDGVGEIAWAGNHCVGAVIDGFIDAVEMYMTEKRCDEQTRLRFMHRLAHTDPAQWTELFLMVLRSYDDAAPDFPVIEKHLADHILTVYSLCRGMASAP